MLHCPPSTQVLVDVNVAVISVAVVVVDAVVVDDFESHCPHSFKHNFA